MSLSSRDTGANGHVETHNELFELYLASNLPQPNLPRLIRNSQHITSTGKCHCRNLAQRRRARGPIPIHRATRQMHQPQRIFLPFATKCQQLPIRTNLHVTRRRRKLIKPPIRLRSLFDRNVIPSDEASTIVDVHHATLRSNDYPAIASQDFWSLVPAEREYSSANRPIIHPARKERFGFHTPFSHLTSLAHDRQPFSITPPRKISNAVFALDTCCCYPLRCAGIQDIDRPATFLRRADQSHIPTTGAEFEPFHAFLFIFVAIDSSHFLDGSGWEIPSVEESPSAGEEDLVACGVEEGGCVDRGVADVDGC